MNRVTFIIDTNVIFSALHKPASKPGLIILPAVYNKINLIAPISVRIEILDKLTKKLKFTTKDSEKIISSPPIRWIEEDIYEEKIDTAKKLISDKTDAPIIALQLISGFPIITGNKEILSTRKTIALNPTQALEFLIKSKIITKEELKHMQLYLQ